MEDRQMEDRMEDHNRRIIRLEDQSKDMRIRLDRFNNKLGSMENLIISQGTESQSLLRMVLENQQKQSDDEYELEKAKFSHREKVQLKVLGWIAAGGGAVYFWVKTFLEAGGQ